MNCTFPSTVYSTILITEAIYIQKIIFTTWRVRKRWWVVLFSFVFWFSVKAKSSDSLENENLIHHPPGPPLNFRLDPESGVCLDHLSNWRKTELRCCTGKCLAEPNFLGGGVCVWLLDLTSWWFACSCFHTCVMRNEVVAVWGIPHTAQMGLQTSIQ